MTSLRRASSTEALWAVNAQAYQVRSLHDVALNREPGSGGLADWSDLLVGFAQGSEQESQLAGYRNGTDIFTV